MCAKDWHLHIEKLKPEREKNMDFLRDELLTNDQKIKLMSLAVHNSGAVDDYQATYKKIVGLIVKPESERKRAFTINIQDDIINREGFMDVIIEKLDAALKE